MAASGESLPEIELRNVRTREQLSWTVGRIKQKSNVPERWRLLVARSRQQLHRDPTPLVAMMVTAGVGIAAIVGGTLIGRSEGGHLKPGREPVLLPTYKPAKTGKDGTYKGAGAFARTPDKGNPREQDKKEWKKFQAKLRKQRERRA